MRHINGRAIIVVFSVICVITFKFCVGEKDGVDPSSSEPPILTRAILVRCPKSSPYDSYKNINSLTKNISAMRSDDILQFHGYDKDELLLHSEIKDCKRKLIITIKLNNCGETLTDEQFVVVDHVYDPALRKKSRLLNPIVIKIRQEQVLQLYGLSFINMVNAQATEEVINKNIKNFTGCDTTSANPTCGLTYLKNKVMPYSEGFCCSCDSYVNVKRQPSNHFKDSNNIGFSPGGMDMLRREEEEEFNRRERSVYEDNNMNFENQDFFGRGLWGDIYTNEAHFNQNNTSDKLLENMFFNNSLPIDNEQQYYAECQGSTNGNNKSKFEVVNEESDNNNNNNNYNKKNDWPIGVENTDGIDYASNPFEDVHSYFIDTDSIKPKLCKQNRYNQFYNILKHTFQRKNNEPNPSTNSEVAPIGISLKHYRFPPLEKAKGFSKDEIINEGKDSSPWNIAHPDNPVQPILSNNVKPQVKDFFHYLSKLKSNEKQDENNDFYNEIINNYIKSIDENNDGALINVDNIPEYKIQNLDNLKQKRIKRYKKNKSFAHDKEIYNHSNDSGTINNNLQNNESVKINDSDLLNVFHNECAVSLNLKNNYSPTNDSPGKCIIEANKLFFIQSTTNTNSKEVVTEKLIYNLQKMKSYNKYYQHSNDNKNNNIEPMNLIFSQGNFQNNYSDTDMSSPMDFNVKPDSISNSSEVNNVDLLPNKSNTTLKPYYKINLNLLENNTTNNATKLINSDDLLKYIPDESKNLMKTVEKLKENKVNLISKNNFNNTELKNDHVATQQINENIENVKINEINKTKSNYTHVTLNKVQHINHEFNKSNENKNSSSSSCNLVKKENLTEANSDESVKEVPVINHYKETKVKKNKYKKVKVQSKQKKNMKKAKRQIMSSGIQFRGGQSCIDRYVPNNADPKTYHESAHCLRFSELWYSVYKLRKPFIQHTVNIKLFEKNNFYDGSTHWKDLTKGLPVSIGTFVREIHDARPTIAFSYLPFTDRQEGDFCLDSVKATLLVPQPLPEDKIKQFPQATGGPKEYLLVKDDEVSVDGGDCDKAGVGFAAFAAQPDRCYRPRGTCLKHQPLDMWNHDQEAKNNKKPGKYFLENYASIPDNPFKSNFSTKEEFLALDYIGPFNSAIEIELRSDLTPIVRVGTAGQLTEIFIDATCDSSTKITVTVTNIGLASSAYFPRMSNCPVEVPNVWTHSEGPLITIPPQHRHIFRMSLYGPLPIDRFHCSMELLNEKRELVATRRMRVQKYDRCLCLYHCLCACIGSLQGLYCEPMSIEHYHASGFQGSLPVTTVLFNTKNSLWWHLYNMLFVYLCIFLTFLFLGLIKAILGFCCCSGIGSWGMWLICTHNAKELESYKEPTIAGSKLKYDASGYIIHPYYYIRNVRLSSTKVEFCLNLVFFIITPIAIIFRLLIICCPCLGSDTAEEENEEDISEEEIQHKLVETKKQKIIGGPNDTESKWSLPSDLEIEEEDDTDFVQDEKKASQKSLEQIEYARSRGGADIVDESCSYYNNCLRSPAGSWKSTVKSQNDLEKEMAKYHVETLQEADFVYRNFKHPIGGVQLELGTTYCVKGLFKPNDNDGYKFVLSEEVYQHWAGESKPMVPPLSLNPTFFEVLYETAEEVLITNELSILPRGLVINVWHSLDLMP